MRRSSSGISLIELVIVIVVISIMTITLLISFKASNQHRVVLRADEFRRAVSHTQLLAISQGKRLRLVTTSTGYSVAEYTCNASNCTAVSGTITDPVTGAAFSVSFGGQNITMTATSIDFDTLGRPQSAGSLRTTVLQVTFSGQNHDVIVNILPITGFAQVI